MFHDPVLRDCLVRGSAWLSFFLYMLTLIGWTRHYPSPRLRWLWTLAWVVFVIHVSLAFHFVHHWSHKEAWEATRLQGGYGDGVYLNYLVILVWMIDVVWWWLWPIQHGRRGRWVTALIHGFLLFMWFNAAVIFAKDYLWMVGALCFAVLAWSYWRASGRKPDVENTK